MIKNTIESPKPYRPLVFHGNSGNEPTDKKTKNKYTLNPDLQKFEESRDPFSRFKEDVEKKFGEVGKFVFDSFDQLHKEIEKNFSHIQSIDARMLNLDKKINEISRRLRELEKQSVKNEKN